MEATSVRAAAVILLLLSVGCGGESIYVYECEAGSSDGSTDSTIDVVDAAKDSPGDSPKDVAPDSACDGEHNFPSVGKCAGGDCDGGGVCCGSLEFDKSCFLTKVVRSCTAPGGCPSAFQPFCGGNATVRLCEGPADCTEPGFDRCCTFAIRCSSTTLVMCASAATATAASASCQ